MAARRGPTGVHILPMWPSTTRLVPPAITAAGLQVACEEAVFADQSTPLATLRRTRRAQPRNLGARVLILAEDSLFTAQAALALRRRYRRRGVDARIVAHLRWSGPDEHVTRYGPITGRLLDILASRWLRRVDTIAFVSEWLRGRYDGALGHVAKRDTTLLRQPIDAAFVAHLPARDAPWRGRLVTTTAFNLADKVAGLDLLADAIAEVPDVQWRVLGGGPLLDDAAWRVTARLGDRVTFSGTVSQEQVIAALDAADVMVYASHLDAHPRAVLEAQTRGLPVIVATGSGATEPVAASGCGIVVPATADAVAAALRDAPGHLDAWRRNKIDPDTYQADQFVCHLLALWQLEDKA